MAYLVDLSITDTGSGGESAAGRESESGRPDGAAGGVRREGRASRPGEGGNAAIRGWLAQLGPIEHGTVHRVEQEDGTNLLNILTDEKGRLRMGVER